MNGEKAQKIAELLIRAEITDDERKGWLEALPKLSNQQIDEFIAAFEEEQKDLEDLRRQTITQLKEVITDILDSKNSADSSASIQTS